MKSYDQPDARGHFGPVNGTYYGGRFVAGIERGDVVACQFHPELISRPWEPHPLFVALVEAMRRQAG